MNDKIRKLGICKYPSLYFVVIKELIDLTRQEK